jgi:hypothetical protein
VNPGPRAIQFFAKVYGDHQESSCLTAGKRLHFCQMSHTITIRLGKELAVWLEETASKSGVAQGQIVREQLEKAKAGGGRRSFMRLAGAVNGPRTLSRRKGFSPS